MASDGIETHLVFVAMHTGIQSVSPYRNLMVHLPMRVKELVILAFRFMRLGQKSRHSTFGWLERFLSFWVKRFRAPLLDNRYQCDTQHPRIARISNAHMLWLELQLHLNQVQSRKALGHLM